MDAVRVALLREVLAGTEWLGATRRFAGVLRASVVPQDSGLLLVGTRRYEPWHLAAHLLDEAAWSGLPALAPTLVRHRVRADDPAHLSTGLGRLTTAGRGQTLLVVAPGEGDTDADAETAPGAGRPAGEAARPGPGAGTSAGGHTDPAAGTGADEVLLERISDVRRAGATVLALTADADRDGELGSLAHELLAVPGGGAVDLDTVQHLVSAAAGENVLPGPRGGRRFRDRLSRLADRLTAPPPERW
ncbi:hypothetical protein [Streptomyces sp. NPDC058657]|uniref:hypothetical protein n=1 Tax=unclassified Streptomyces TaxID=2593676 RepID=UPI003661F0D2